MEAYAQVLLYAIPFFMALIFIEWVIGRSMGVQTIVSFDTISSLSSGISNIIKDILGLIVIIVSYEWMYQNLRLFDLHSSILMYVLAFIGLDFAGYWTHRFEHVVNIFWNRHIIHHSSEEYNLSCALRQNFSAVFAVFTFLLLPCALFGLPPQIIAVVAPLHLFAQFWYHTRLIKKMGILEYIIVTPSHHRVHHAINKEYLDKNFGQIFIFWDKLFGTFQEEMDKIPPVYGVKRPVHTWNPILINFQHFWLLLSDAWHTKHILDKLKIWFMPTGWRPADVINKYTIEVIEDPKELNKYKTQAPLALVLWSWLQLLLCLGFVFHFLSVIGKFPYPMLLLYGGFIVSCIYAFTSLMDWSFHALFGELTRLTVVIYFFIKFGSWFGNDIMVLIIYCLISFGIALYFTTQKNSYQPVNG